ncbi:hypothetical protein [Gordonia bronchialis]|uniref:hypothetical protein n=1 Tax=Gordonia bronchialis TaxID=2054 RepID=UPI002270D61B|nr:hypothetical protein [Gordonia bronchialis]
MLEHLAYGWLERNVDVGGTGFGVLARSPQWPATVGDQGSRLGSLVKRSSVAQDWLYTREFRGHRLLVRNNPVYNSREGSYLVHIVDISDSTIGTRELLSIIATGLPYATMDRFTDRLPTVSATPLTVPGDTAQQVRLDNALVDVVAALLECADGAASAIEFVGAAIPEIVTVLLAALSAIPVALHPYFDVDSTAPLAAGAVERGRTCLTVTGVNPDERVTISLTRPAPGPSAWTSNGPAGKYGQLAAKLIAVSGINGRRLPQSTSVAALMDWAESQELMLRPASQLSDDEVTTVLSGGTEARRWLDRPANVDRAVDIALRTDVAATRLAEHHATAPIGRLPRKLCDALYHSDTEISVAQQILRRFGIPWENFADLAADHFVRQAVLPVRVTENRSLIVFPVVAETLSPADAHTGAVGDDLLRRFDSFRRQVADSSNTELVRRLLQLQIHLPAGERDVKTFRKIARRGPGLVSDMLARSDPAGTQDALEWTLAALPVESATQICQAALKKGADASLVLAAIDGVTMADADLRYAVAHVWPWAARALGVPERIGELLVVAPGQPASPVEPIRDTTMGREAPCVDDETHWVAATERRDTGRPGMFAWLRTLLSGGESRSSDGDAPDDPRRDTRHRR